MVSLALVSSATLAAIYTTSSVSLFFSDVLSLNYCISFFSFGANQYPLASAVTDFGHWLFFLFWLGRRRHSSSLRGIEIDTHTRKHKHIVDSSFVFFPVPYYGDVCIASKREENIREVITRMVRARAHAKKPSQSIKKSKAIGETKDDG